MIVSSSFCGTSSDLLIVWNIYHFCYPACTKSLCTPAAGEVDPDLFKDFKRSLTWDISVPERTVLTLDFPGGIKELSGEEHCQDGLQYSVSTTKSGGRIEANSYCKGGTVSHLDLLGATTVTMEVTKEEELDSTAFTVQAASRGKSLFTLETKTSSCFIYILSKIKYTRHHFS